MERYVQISVAELLDLISKGEFKKIYFKRQDGPIDCADRYNHDLSEIHNKMWFRREVIK